MNIDQEKLEEFRLTLQEINRGPENKAEKLALFQAVESERRVDMVLHKLNSLEANIIAEMAKKRQATSTGGIHPQLIPDLGEADKKAKKRWWSRKKKSKKGVRG